MLSKSFRLPLLWLMFILVALLLTACNITPASSTVALTIPVSNASIPMSTMCPSPGSGRSAHLPPFTVKQHPDVVYLTQGNNRATVHAYNTVTRKTQNLLTFTNQNSNVEASVSPDSHWITLITQQPTGSYAIQLVRSDGAYAQTLYCSQGMDTLSGALLSPDRHYLAFNEKNMQTLTDTLNVLDTTTGKIHTLLSSQQPSYPDVLSSQQPNAELTSHSGLQTQTWDYAPRMMPLSGPTPINIYVPIRWINNSSLYVMAMPIEPSSGLALHQLYQVLDIKTSVNQQSSNLKSLTASLQQNGCLSYDITLDNTRLICSAGPTLPSDTTIPAIDVAPLTDGTWHTIFQAAPGSQVHAQAAEGQTILFAVNNGTHGSQLYRVQTDGTHLKLLASSKDMFSQWNGTLQFLPWANVSFDGKAYALELTNASGVNSVVIGSMDGGTTTTISSDMSTLIGWTAA